MEIKGPYFLAPVLETGVKYSATQQKNLLRLLTTPHRAQVLRMNGITFNENAVVQRSTQTRSNYRAILTRTPVTTADNMAHLTACNSEVDDNSPYGEQNNAPSSLDKALPPMPDLSAVNSINQRGVPAATDTSCKEGDLAIRPLDPRAAKVLLSTFETSLSDDVSFTPTSSMGTLADVTNTGVEIGIAKNVNLRVARRQSSSGIVHPVRISATLPATRISEDRVAFGHIAAQKYGSPTQRRRMKNSDITTERVDHMEYKRVGQDTIKLVEQEPPVGFELNISEPQAIPAATCGQQERLLGNEAIIPKNDSPNESMVNSLHGSDNKPRRISNKYGMGPTIRFSMDAHEIIMGPPGFSRKNVAFEESLSAQEVREPQSRLGSLPMSRTSHRRLTHTSRIKVPSQATSNRTTEPSQKLTDSTSQARLKKSSPTFAIRSSSLPTPTVSLKASEHKVPPVPVDPLTARLSRPTKASRARAAESKSTLFERGQKGAADPNPNFNRSSITSCPPNALKQTRADILAASISKTSSASSIKKDSKGFKGRLFSIIPSFRRSNHDILVIPSTSHSRSSHERNASNHDGDLSNIQTNPRSVFWNLVPNDGGNYRSSSEDVCHSANWHTSDHKPATNLLQRRNDIKQLSDAHETSETVHQSELTRNFVHSTPSAGGAHSSNHCGEPTPPPSRECPSTHSTEKTSPRRPFAADQVNYDENGVGLYLDQLLQHAENQFHQVVEAGNASANLQARTAIREILEPLAAAIAATRAARISAIALTNANAELLKYTAALSGQACQAALTTTKISPLGNSASEK